MSTSSFTGAGLGDKSCQNQGHEKLKSTKNLAEICTNISRSFLTIGNDNVQQGNAKTIVH